MRKPAVIIVGSLVLCTGIVIGLRRVTLRPPPSPPSEEPLVARADDPAAAEPEPPKPVVRAELLGLLTAGESVDLESKASGRIQRIAVKPGESVKAGQVLIELDVGGLRRDLAMAKANLREARARLLRRQPLAQDGVVSSDELADARVVVRTKEERVNQLLEQVSQAEIAAPFAGTVAARYADAGAVVGPGKPILRLLGSGGLRVRFVAPEERAAELAVNVPVRIRVPSQDKSLMGIIESIAPEVDSASRMIYGEARIDGGGVAPAAIAAGVVARVTLLPAGGS